MSSGAGKTCRPAPSPADMINSTGCRISWALPLQIKRCSKRHSSIWSRRLTTRKQGAGDIFPMGQNHQFFLTVLRLEAKILGHLGSQYYASNVGNYLTPVEVQGRLDEFIGVEPTLTDEQSGITIPPLPHRNERRILYWLTPLKDGNYDVKDSTQIIDRIGNPARITVLRGRPPVVVVSDVTYRVQERGGFPVEYTKCVAPFLRFQLTSKGFSEELQ